jgi:hypothetical protein
MEIEVRYTWSSNSYQPQTITPLSVGQTQETCASKLIRLRADTRCTRRSTAVLRTVCSISDAAHRPQADTRCTRVQRVSAADGVQHPRCRNCNLRIRPILACQHAKTPRNCKSANKTQSRMPACKKGSNYDIPTMRSLAPPEFGLLSYFKT